MRLHILSDLHLESGTPQVSATDADVVVLAGNIHVGVAGLEWARERFPGQPVTYVLGNHEFYHHSIPELAEEFKQASVGGRIHVLENEDVEIDGYTFLECTLWTDFRIWPDPDAAMLLAGERMFDFHAIEMRRLKRLFRPWDSVKLYESSVAWLYRELRKHDPARTIVVMLAEDLDQKARSEDDRNGWVRNAQAVLSLSRKLGFWLFAVRRSQPPESGTDERAH